MHEVDISSAYVSHKQPSHLQYSLLSYLQHNSLLKLNSTAKATTSKKELLMSPNYSLRGQFTILARQKADAAQMQTGRHPSLQPQLDPLEGCFMRVHVRVHTHTTYTYVA